MDFDKISKDLAKDLAIVYAKSKFDHELAIGTNFDGGLAPAEIEELEYLIGQFLSAYDYYSNIGESEWASRMNWPK